MQAQRGILSVISTCAQIFSHPLATGANTYVANAYFAVRET
jgi:hypothetical protein